MWTSGSHVMMWWEGNFTAVVLFLKPSLIVRKYQTNTICWTFYKISHQCLSEQGHKKQETNYYRLEESKETWLTVTWSPILYPDADIGGKTSEMWRNLLV